MFIFGNKCNAEKNKSFEILCIILCFFNQYFDGQMTRHVVYGFHSLLHFLSSLSLFLFLSSYFSTFFSYHQNVFGVNFFSFLLVLYFTCGFVFLLLFLLKIKLCIKSEKVFINLLYIQKYKKTP